MEGGIEWKEEQTNEWQANVTRKYGNTNYFTFYIIAGPKSLIMYEGCSQRRDTIYFLILQLFNMDPVLTTDAGSDQIAMCITSRQCVKGAGADVGAGVLDDGKGMITRAIG